jgi:putative transcriptional regulator
MNTTNTTTQKSSADQVRAARTAAGHSTSEAAALVRATSPSADQVRAARMAAGHSTTQAAALVHMDARSWRYYEQGNRAMHPAIWELYRIKCAINPTNG